YARAIFGKNLVILNHGQMKIPEPALHSPNFHTIPAGRRLTHEITFHVHQSHTHGQWRTGQLARSHSGPLYWLLIANEALNLQFDEGVRLLAYADDFYLFIKATGKHTIQGKATRALEQLAKGLRSPLYIRKQNLSLLGRRGNTNTLHTADSLVTPSNWKGD
ncbi:hypothetical protein AVEN_50218-1, partial [Araneus ventricosus]